MFLITIVLFMLAGDTIWWSRSRAAWPAKSIGRRCVDAWAGVMAAALVILIVGRASGFRVEDAFPRVVLSSFSFGTSSGSPSR